jgi:CheY-like chemotaxis protein
MTDEGSRSGEDAPAVLVVDDEPVIRELVRSVLSRDGRFRLLCAGDGAEAVELAREHQPQLVLLDVRMPHMNGIEACRAMRDDPGSASATIVMLTAMGQDDDIARGYDAGADDYFLKPFKPSELLERVQEALGLAAA